VAKKKTPTDAQLITQLGRAGIRLQAKISALHAELTAVKAEMQDVLERDRQDQPELQMKTYDIGATGKVEATWKPEYPVDAERAAKLAEEMDPAAFAKVFITKLSFSRARSYGSALRNASAEIDPFAARIKQAVRTKPAKSAKITFVPAPKDK